MVRVFRRFFINCDYSTAIASFLLTLLIYFSFNERTWVPLVKGTLQWAPAAMISLLGFALTAWAIVISLLDRGRVSAFKKSPASWKKLSNSFKINAILALLTATYSAFIDGLRTTNELGVSKLGYAPLAFFEIAVFLQVLKVVHLLHRVAIAAVYPTKEK